MVIVDHYIVLGLPSGEEGAKLSDSDIHKAYKSKALLLHPDKRRRDDPNAHANFLELQKSFQVLKDEKARKSFDDQLRIEREKKDRQRDYSKKRRRMISDLVEEEERYYRQRDSSKRPSASNFGVDLTREEEERYSRTLNEEIERIIARHSKQTQNQKQEHTTDDSGGNNYNSSSSKKEYATYNGGNTNIDNGLYCNEKVVKVLWEKTRIGEDYTAQRLYEIFGKYGCVEDVVIRRKKGSALVVMESKDAAIAIATAGYGLDDDGSNPLRVELLQPGECTELGNIVGAGYRDYEKSVLEKMRRKASKLG